MFSFLVFTSLPSPLASPRGVVFQGRPHHIPIYRLRSLLLQRRLSVPRHDFFSPRIRDCFFFPSSNHVLFVTRPQIMVAKWAERAAAVLLLLGAAALGGLTNHIRGGWLRLPKPSDYPKSLPVQVVVHDMLLRLSFAVPLAMAIAVLLRMRKRKVSSASPNDDTGTFGGLFFVPTANQRSAIRICVPLLVAVLTWWTLDVGWGVYVAIGRNPDCYKSRAGAFDWLIGHCSEDWASSDSTALFDRRWVHDLAGMSWRGLLWTLPVGTVFQHCGLGWEAGLAGAAMGWIYDLGWLTETTASEATAGFATGPPVAEPYWGFAVWLATLIPVLAYRKALAPVTRRHWTTYLLHATQFLCGAVFLVSAIWYTATVRQKDERNKDQTVAGLFVAAIVVLLGEVVWVARMFQSRHSAAATGAGRQRLGFASGTLSAGNTAASDDGLFGIQDDGADNRPLLEAGFDYESTPRRFLRRWMTGIPHPWAELLAVLRMLDVILMAALVVLTIIAVAWR
jgi:hypothetical protein